jgi:hypothetical protein
LFYAIGERTVYIGDDPDWMNENPPDSSCDQDAATEFLLTGYVTGNDTFDEEIKQLVLVDSVGCLVVRRHTVSKQPSQLTGFARY